MMYNTNPLHGELTIPGDKSISHRSVMFASLAKGTSHIKGFLPGADCLSTIHCFRQMGIEIYQEESMVTVTGQGMRGLKKPKSILDCGNSGTTTRLISGILAGQNFTSTLTGDESIQKRPMKRIILPLTQMGASIASLRDNGCAPLQITGRPLHGITYHSPVASAQVKSAILLAGLYAEGETSVIEPSVSRNHTEIMLKAFGADVSCHDTTASVHHTDELFASNIEVPGDISSAAYFIVAALMIPNSDIILHNVGINPTRDGLLRAIEMMGGKIEILSIKNEDTEAIADLHIKSQNLHGATFGGDIIPAMIDEIPALAALACFAEGETIIKDAEELKVKESNRIKVMVEELSKMGAQIEETEDGMIIHGKHPLHSAQIDSHKDHRIAMTFSILSRAIGQDLPIIDKDCVKISYPNFYEHLHSLSS
ncbi:3-phosphoshikimate 1-carboxyvinyltransferase [Lachnospiraceae bacterium oral taxon 096]|nr:3-phosphoshikimate 1-carboxyvinyltransferase [Lachnospiraceae bacterium oral taxon 096]